MPDLPELPEPYFIRINGARCKGASEYVLEPSGDKVLLQPKDSAAKAQRWSVIPVFGEHMHWSGIAFVNVSDKRALMNAGYKKGLTTKPWEETRPDQACAWQIRASKDHNHPGESSIASALDDCFIDQGNHDECNGAVVITYSWEGNNNQYWIVERA